VFVFVVLCVIIVYYGILLFILYFTICMCMGLASNTQQEAIASSWILQNKKRPGWSVV